MLACQFWARRSQDPIAPERVPGRRARRASRLRVPSHRRMRDDEPRQVPGAWTNFEYRPRLRAIEKLLKLRRTIGPHRADVHIKALAAAVALGIGEVRALGVVDLIRVFDLRAFDRRQQTPHPLIWQQCVQTVTNTR